VALKCWHEFNICGYIRVDLRLDMNGNPNVLEINANPCLSENGGFYAACIQKGYTFKDIVERIVEDAYR
jgi:D-alanine-D-alanine ligase